MTKENRLARKIHLRTIRAHRKYVRKTCWKMGLFWQGLTHDLSKYSHKEMTIAKYANGKQSPHQVCRDLNGYSPSWLHHYHKNKHHFQYWWDENELGDIVPIKMPYKYVIEMFCDMVGAGKAYLKDKWNTKQPAKYYKEKCQNRIMHTETRELLESLLNMLALYEHEYAFYDWYNRVKKITKEQYENKTDEQRGD